MRAIDLIAGVTERIGRRVRRLRRRLADRSQRLRERAWDFVQREDRTVPAQNDLERAKRDREIDEAGRESFPASDPPSWTSRGTC